jgi:phosphatidylinositol alpha-1,6-mannosyltransferase
MESILLGLTGLNLDGGISSVSRSIVHVLDAEAAAGRLRFADRVLLHDERESAPEPPPCGRQALAGGKQWLFALQLIRSILVRRPDLVFFDHVGLGRALLPSLPGPRPVYDVFAHGLELVGAEADERSKVFRGARRIHVNSPVTAERVEEMFPELASRIRIIPLCIEPAKAEQWRALAVDAPAAGERRPAALIVGRIWASQPGKGHDALIEGWPIVRRSVPDAELWIVGQGDDGQRLRELAARHDVSECVRFFGRVSDADLFQLYREASIFAMPSCQEGFGLVYLEAMRHGLPCIGSTADAAAFVIDDSCGLLVPYGDAVATAEAVAMLLSDSERRERLAAGGRARVTENFGIESFRAKLLDGLFRQA